MSESMPSYNPLEVAVLFGMPEKELTDQEIVELKRKFEGEDGKGLGKDVCCFMVRRMPESIVPEETMRLALDYYDHLQSAVGLEGATWPGNTHLTPEVLVAALSEIDALQKTKEGFNNG